MVGNSNTSETGILQVVVSYGNSEKVGSSATYNFNWVLVTVRKRMTRFCVYSGAISKFSLVILKTCIQTDIIVSSEVVVGSRDPLSSFFA